jgi:hypothetical protein
MEIFRDVDEKISKELSQKVATQSKSDEEAMNNLREWQRNAGNNGIMPNVVYVNADADDEGMNTNTVTSGGWGASVDHMDQPAAGDFMNNRFPFLRDAHRYWVIIPRQDTLTDPTMMDLYEKLFNDMTSHASEWENFWANIKNCVWCERSVGVINTFATVLRRRAYQAIEEKRPSPVVAESLLKCESILNLGGKLLVLYKAMLYHADSLRVVWQNDETRLIQGKKCCRGLTYRYFLIKHNLLMMTSRVKHAPPNEVRFMCEFEIEEYPDPWVDECNGTAIVLLGNLKRPHTRAALNATTDREIRQVYERQFNKSEMLIATSSRMCSQCGQFEEPTIKFKACSRCKCEFYCSRDCQLAGWKVHKVVCNGGGEVKPEAKTDKGHKKA